MSPESPHSPRSVACCLFVGHTASDPSPASRATKLHVTAMLTQLALRHTEQSLNNHSRGPHRAWERYIRAHVAQSIVTSGHGEQPQPRTLVANLRNSHTLESQ
eukprot:750661-Rhodomonas_salina.3